MSEWDKLREMLKNEVVVSVGTSYKLYPLVDRLEAVGDKLRERVEYLEGLTDGDVKLISKLQQENKMIQIKAMSLALQLEAIRGIVAEYPKCDKNGLAFECDELITRILAVLDGSAQNTDYVQKEDV